MDVYKFSVEAESDLSTIYEYDIIRFGLTQAKSYFQNLQKTFKILTQNPNMGRNVDELYPNLKKFGFQSHLIFYLPSENGIYVLRVLHHSMDYEVHF